MQRDVVGCAGYAVGAGRFSQITRNRGSHVRAVSESVARNLVRERQIIDNFLIGVCNSRRRWGYAKTRRSRVATKHWMRPVNASVYDCYVNALPFVAFVEMIELC